MVHRDTRLLYIVGIHYCVNMVLIAVSTILSVMIINLGQPNSSKPPKWLLKVSHLNVFVSFHCAAQKWSF